LEVKVVKQEKLKETKICSKYKKRGDLAFLDCALIIAYKEGIVKSFLKKFLELGINFVFLCNMHKGMWF
jgi:hypothetical protein